MPKDLSKRCRENPLQYEGIRHLFVPCKEASFEANMGGTTRTSFSSRQVFTGVKGFIIFWLFS